MQIKEKKKIDQAPHQELTLERNEEQDILIADSLYQ